MYNRPLYKGHCLRSQIFTLPIVLVHLQPPRRGQPLYKGQNKWIYNNYCPHCVSMFRGSTVYVQVCAMHTHADHTRYIWPKCGPAMADAARPSVTAMSTCMCRCVVAGGRCMVEMMIHSISFLAEGPFYSLQMCWKLVFEVLWTTTKCFHRPIRSISTSNNFVLVYTIGCMYMGM